MGRLSSLAGPYMSAGAFRPRIAWRGHEIVPIGFGISKLVVTCVINSDDVERLAEMIAETEEDEVQSVDIAICRPVASDLTSVFADKLKHTS